MQRVNHEKNHGTCYIVTDEVWKSNFEKKI